MPVIGYQYIYVLAVWLIPVVALSETLVDFGRTAGVNSVKGNGAAVEFVRNKFAPALRVSTRSEERGPLHPGLILVQNQEERAEAFMQYVMDTLKHPTRVGYHWFQYSDSPTTGRSLDGENYQIGFTDTCDTPYPEMIKASRSIAEQMYTIRTGDAEND